MKVSKSVLLLLLALLATFSLSLFYILSSSPKFSHNILQARGHSSEIDLPYRYETRENEQYVIKSTLAYSSWMTSSIRIIADDCVTHLKINNINVDLKEISTGSLCDYTKGFTIDLLSYLERGDNSFEVTITNSGGATGFSIQHDQDNVQFFVAWALLLFSIFIISFIVTDKLNFPVFLSLLFALGVVIRILMLEGTAYDLFTHDVYGHIDYIKYMAHNFNLPQASECWQCYQQPLYYILATPIYLIADSIAIFDTNKSLQTLSLFLNSGFLLFILLTLKQVKLSKITLIFVGSIAIFMPAMVIHSVRIGNDALMYFAFSGSLYFYIRWIDEKKGLPYAVALAIIALFSKTNGVIAMGVLGLSFLLYLYYQNNKREYIRILVTTVALFVSALILSTYLHTSRNKENSIVGNASTLNHKLLVDNRPINYLYFDLKNYLQEPFTSPWDDDKGRQYFWNYLLKSSLFGEFTFYKESLKIISYLIGAIYLLIIFGTLYGFLQLNKSSMIKYFPFIVNGGLLIVGALYLRMSIPSSCSNDFRYITPIILSGILFLGLTLDKIRHSPYVILKLISFGSVGLFSFLSLLFFILQ